MHTPQCVPSVATMGTVAPVQNPYLATVGTTASTLSTGAMIEPGTALVVSASAPVAVVGYRSKDKQSGNVDRFAVWIPAGVTRIVFPTEINRIEAYNLVTNIEVIYWIEDVQVLGHFWDRLIAAIRGDKCVR